MKFVNKTNRKIYTEFCGWINPGAESRDGSDECLRLETVLSEIIEECGDRLGIKLNDKELALIKKVMDLDETGCNFDPKTIPAYIRNDPDGEKRASQRSLEAQKAEMERISAKNAHAAQVEAEINGETSRKPVGPGTMQGESFEPSMLKTGFEELLEENAKIASKKEAMDVEMALDPIGKNMKQEGAEPAAASATETEASIGKDPSPVEQAYHKDGDVTKSADTSVPQAEPVNRASAMDLKAAEMAEAVSTLGPVTPKAKRTSRKPKAK